MTSGIISLARRFYPASSYLYHFISTWLACAIAVAVCLLATLTGWVSFFEAPKKERAPIKGAEKWRPRCIKDFQLIWMNLFWGKHTIDAISIEPWFSLGYALMFGESFLFRFFYSHKKKALPQTSAQQFFIPVQEQFLFFSFFFFFLIRNRSCGESSGINELEFIDRGFLFIPTLSRGR